MYIVENYGLAVALCWVTMLCWGSWGNTQKLAAKTWRYELFYWDYVVGILLFSLIWGFTLGSTGEAGRGFVDDLLQVDISNLVSTFLGGVIFNASNILLSSSMSLAGMSVAFPVGVGLALVLGVFINYFSAPQGDATVLFSGVFLIVLAIIFNGIASGKVAKGGTDQAMRKKGIIIAVCAGILMAFFYRFVAAAMDLENLEAPTVGMMTPYSALFVFAVGIFVSNFFFNTLVMKKPFVGKPIAYSDYFSGNVKTHLVGILGGTIWALGTACSYIAAGKEKLHFYYSHLDWTREDYPWGRTGRGTGRPNPKGDWKSYYQFMNNQLTELLTNYGPVGAIWFDGWWDQDGNPGFNWELPEQYAMIHKLQPGCLIGNNHHQTPFAGEDIQIFERDLPGENTAGLSGQSVSHLPLETCETMNGMWGYKITDQNYKSTKTLIHYLVKAAGKNANLLMNIGPQPDGELAEVAVQRLKEMGEWMNQYGETIYGTRGGAVAPHDWGVTTQKGNKLYVHILNLQDKALFLPLADKKVKKAVLFKNGTPVRFNKNKEGVLLELAEIPKDIDYVVELTID